MDTRRHKQKKQAKTAKLGGAQSKQAFIFTLDALLVLPLLIIIISALIAFSSTFRENILLHEYTYIIAKDSVDYLSDLEIGQASISGLSINPSESTFSVLGYVTRHITDKYETNTSINGALYSQIPSFAGYIFEYKNSTGDWAEISRGGNVTKLEPNNYNFQVSVVKVITGLSDPIIITDPCNANLLCQAPQSLYIKGEIAGPIMFRMRVFV